MTTAVTAPRKTLLLALCCVSVLLIGIDMTGVNVALPTIGARFHAGTSGLAWVVDAYTVTLAAFLLFASSTADRLGRRRIFVAGLTVFVVGSALCAVAPTLGWLIVFRVVQALGAAALNRSPWRSSAPSTPSPPSAPARSASGAA